MLKWFKAILAPPTNNPKQSFAYVDIETDNFLVCDCPHRPCCVIRCHQTNREVKRNMNRNGLSYDDLHELKTAHDINYQSGELTESAYRAALSRLGMNATEIASEVEALKPVAIAFGKGK